MPIACAACCSSIVVWTCYMCWVGSLRQQHAAGPMLGAFQGSEHLPFLWSAGKAAALLVHGFPGTPAEMRPLGQALFEAGWTVQGLLLPGFGPQLSTLDRRTYGEWLGAVHEALAQLRREHSPVLLVGYSMGGALAIAAAAGEAPDGLALLAPFTWAEGPLQRYLGRLLRPLMPRFLQPFRWFNLDEPQARRLIGSLLPGVDLDDEATKEQLQQTSVSVSFLEQLRTAGLQALDRASAIRMPTLVVVGRKDELVTLQRTRPLLQRLGAARLVEVDAGHDMVSAASPGYSAMVQAVLDLADSLSTL
jgi:carboxylesterase